MSEETFKTDVEQTITIYERATGRVATRTRKMIGKHGEIAALSRLMINTDLQQGFKVLCKRGQLDNSFESVVIRFQHLFGTDTIQAARWRLAHLNELL
ncbi:MAG: hypothetical protein ABSG48_00365 [Geobacteraceae bacterium]|jgi:hypothetical protein